MTYDWLVHAATFLILVSYRGRGAHYRAFVSLAAAAMTGLSLALTVYALKFPPNPFITVGGVILLAAVLRCRGNVAKLFPAKKARTPQHDIPKKSHR